MSDHYPLPILSGDSKTVLSSIDLISGFWQFPLDAKSREITVFSTPFGHYVWLRLPMGPRNAPLTFQRMVNSPSSGLTGNGMFFYFDDLIIVSKDLGSQLYKLDVVFAKLEEAGLKAKLSKCDFPKSRIEFLFHVVDGDGIHTFDSKIYAVKHFPTSQNVENVRSFLGLSGYYRAFVCNFAYIVSPLTVSLKKMFSSFGMTLSVKPFTVVYETLFDPRTCVSLSRLQEALYPVYGSFIFRCRCCVNASI